MSEPPPQPLADWSRDRVHAIYCAWGDMGWFRWSPVGAGTLLFEVVGADRPRPQAEVLADTARDHGRHPYHSQITWAEPDDVPDFTCVPADLRALFQAREHAHHADIRHRHRRVGELARTLGVARLDTAADTVDYLLAAGVLCRIPRGGTTLLVPAVPIPLPAERLALTAAERRAEDAARWLALFEGTGDRIIERLGPDHERFTTSTASPATRARRLDLDPEEVRQAFLALLAAPDFSTDADLARVPDDTPFAFTVDWGIVNWTRTVTPLDEGGA